MPAVVIVVAVGIPIGLLLLAIQIAPLSADATAVVAKSTKQSISSIPNVSFKNCWILSAV
jgi:hypothetical protein